jgi:pimeloyl-ACP methyl ester carboxylesterase
MNSNRYSRSLWHGAVAVACLIAALGRGAIAAQEHLPPPTGPMVDLGGHRLHVNCMGHVGGLADKGIAPTVVVETGLGDFSFDWILVQRRVFTFARICTYDRGGYAWSDPGPIPRTYAQLNLELHDALAKLGERGPFVLVGHSFGGPVVRNYAITYPHEVAGIVFVDAAEEESRFTFGSKAILIRGSAKGRAIPAPREEMTEQEKSAARASAEKQGEGPASEQKLDSMYEVLPQIEQSLHLWAQSLRAIDDAENSQRDWSPEYLQKWHDTPQAGTLGKVPVMVLMRAKGGYGNDLDISAEELERERVKGQFKLALLSSNRQVKAIASGHNMDLEAPEDVAAAIREVVAAVRSGDKLSRLTAPAIERQLHGPDLF